MFADHPKSVLLLGVLGVSISAILVRWSQAPSVVTAAYRLGWTVLLLLPAVLTRFRAELLRVRGRDVALCALSGLCLALHFLTWFESLKWTGVAMAAAILLAFGGSALLALAGGGTGSQLYGNLLALAAAFFVAMYTLIGRVQRGCLSTTVYTFLTYLACFLALVFMAIGSGTPLVGYPPREWLIGLGLAVLCTLMGHSLFSWCLKYLSPAYVSAAKLCEPVFSGALAVPLFGEIPGPMQLVGAAIILGSVLLYTKAESA